MERPVSCTMHLALALSIVLSACGGARGSVGPESPKSAEAPTKTDEAMPGSDDTTTCVVDGKKISFSELQARLGELLVDPTPVSKANLEVRDGGFGGTEERYAARMKANGDYYEYVIVRTPTHHHYELTLQKRGDGRPIAPASPEPARITETTLDGRQVDERTFDRFLGTLDVDAEPWINAHLADSEGRSGGSATFEARDRKTGELWTYEVSSVGDRSSRSLSRGSRKSSTPRRQ